MTHTREDVLASTRALFGEQSLTDILSLLDEYGRESYELEENRVKLAILELSEGDKEKLEYFVKIAKTDYRDVLAAQELGPLSPEVGEQLQALTRSIVESWGKK